MALVWLTLLALHAGAAGIWWWLSPGGFPSGSTELWVGQVAPWAVIVVLVAALVARGRLSEKVLPPILAALPLFWMSFGLSAKLQLDESFRALWNLPFLGGFVVGFLWVRQFRAYRPRWVVALVALPVVAAGWALPGTLRAPDPATTPRGEPLGEVPGGASDHKVLKLSRDAQLRPAEARVVVRRGALVLNVQPLLTFADRSPDRCLVALAPAELSRPTARTLLAKVADGGGWRLFYRDEDLSLLEVAARGRNRVTIRPATK
jgi:hypothetical protein